ncbi:hypothetical protein LXL04_016266 [Taraxacum kok-saghyz]
MHPRQLHANRRTAEMEDVRGRTGTPLAAEADLADDEGSKDRNLAGKCQGRRKEWPPREESTGSDDVHMMGICGIGGVGKTTLARTVFNKIYFSSKAKASLRRLRVLNACLSILKLLQNKVLSDFLND